MTQRAIPCLTIKGLLSHTWDFYTHTTTTSLCHLSVRSSQRNRQPSWPRTGKLIIYYIETLRLPCRLLAAGCPAVTLTCRYSLLAGVSNQHEMHRSGAPLRPPSGRHSKLHELQGLCWTSHSQPTRPSPGEQAKRAYEHAPHGVRLDSELGSGRQRASPSRLNGPRKLH